MRCQCRFTLSHFCYQTHSLPRCPPLHWNPEVLPQVFSHGFQTTWNGTLGSLGGPGSRFHSQLLGQDLLFIAPGVIIHFSWLHYLKISENDGCISRLVRWVDECIFRQPKTMEPVYGSNTIAWANTQRLYKPMEVGALLILNQRQRCAGALNISHNFKATTPRDSVHLSEYKYQPLSSITVSALSLASISIHTDIGIRKH